MLSVPRLIAKITAQGGTLKLVDDHLEVVCGPTPLIASTEIEIKTRFEEVKRYLVAQASARRGNPQPCSAIPTPSFTQQLWWQWQGGKAGISSPSLTVPIIRFMQASSLEVVEAAIRSVIVRHDILRWRFVDNGGDLKIIVNDPSCFVVERDVLECTSREDISRVTLQQMEEFSRRAMFATDDWLTRAKVIQLTKQDFMAILVSNHIISDGRSAQIISAELDRLVCDGCIAEEPSERLQFSDYVWWEKDWFARSGDKVISYWRDWQKQLRPFLAPTTGRKLVWQPGEKTSYKIHFDPKIAATVKNAARKLSSTPALIYLTALALGTINWSRQSQFAVRCAGDARSHPRWQRVVGLITAADPVCIEANGCVEFDEILQSLQCELRSAMMLRTPSLHAYPADCTASTILNQSSNLPVVYNYLPALRGPGTTLGTSSGARRPPKLEKGTPIHSFYRVSPINLLVQESQAALDFEFTLHNALLTKVEQTALVTEVVTAFYEHVVQGE